MIAIAVASAVACGGSSSPSSPSTNAIAAFAGTWTAATLPSGSADLPGCTDFRYSVTPTGAAAASIAYSTTCSGLAVSGTGNGAVSGPTLNWTTIGSAGPCAFSLGGAATASGASDLGLTYSGTVCGIPINGEQTLHK